MELKNYVNNKIERKSFFKAIGFAALGFTALRSFPLNLFSKQKNVKAQKIKVEINSLAVQRKKDRRNV